VHTPAKTAAVANARQAHKLYRHHQPTALSCNCHEGENGKTIAQRLTEMKAVGQRNNSLHKHNRHLPQLIEYSAGRRRGCCGGSYVADRTAASAKLAADEGGRQTSAVKQVREA